MVFFHRVVTTNWSYKEVGKKTAGSIGLAYKHDYEADMVLRDDVLHELNYLNVGRREIPFRHDFNGNYDCIIRFWDGDDYRLVKGYDIHSISTDANNLEKGNFYRYRGYLITPNEKHTSFTVEARDGSTLCRKRKLENALKFIDELELSFDNRC